MSDFTSLLGRFEWKAMRNCPGRYILAEPASRLRPVDLAREAPLSEYRVEAAPDPVVVARIGGGGIISYKKPDGSYLHTLNTNEGFERKLRQLGINLPD
jgi:hypothetical protein